MIWSIMKAILVAGIVPDEVSKMELIRDGTAKEPSKARMPVANSGQPHQ